MPPPALAWGIVAALFLAYIVSFVDRMIIGLLVDSIKADLKISDTQVSLLQGLAFASFFTIAAIPLGRLIDRANRTRVVAAGIATWSVMTMACGFVSNFGGMFVVRMGVGVGEAVLSPAAYSMISDSFDRRSLGLAMGVFGLGSAIGAGLAFMIGGLVVALVAHADSVSLPIIGAMRPWRFAFFVAGMPGFLVAGLFLILRDPSHAAGARPPATTVAEIRTHLATNAGFFWSVFLGVAAVNLSVLGTVNWLPAMLVRGGRLNLPNAGFASGAMLIVGGLIGMIGFGFAMDRIGGGTPAARMRFCGWSTGIAVIAAAAFPLVSSLWLMAILFIAFFSAAAGVVSAAPSVLQQFSPSGMRATIAALYVFIINLVGIGIGPSVTAGLGDTLFPGGDGIRYAMAMVAPVGYAIGCTLFFNAARYAGSSTRPGRFTIGTP